jgi:hypothetical protein
VIGVPSGSIGSANRPFGSDVSCLLGSLPLTIDYSGRRNRGGSWLAQASQRRPRAVGRSSDAGSGRWHLSQRGLLDRKPCFLAIVRVVGHQVGR